MTNPETPEITDPIERIIADALLDADVPFLPEGVPGNEAGLDFYLPEQNVYIECKQFHSDRTNMQMKKAHHIILVQGRKAAEHLASLIRSSRTPKLTEAALKARVEALEEGLQHAYVRMKANDLNFGAQELHDLLPKRGE